jgi:prephenate dehydrogenase
MQCIAIVGVGLIGGSFGLALRKAGFTGRILGVSSAPAIAEAVRQSAIDQGVPLEDAAEEADVLYLSQPISGILETIRKLAACARKGCLVTDAGSTKQAIVSAATAALPQCCFLGGHPMAGKEARGVGAADADLFRDRTYVLTPQDPHQARTPIERVFIEWIERVGSSPVFLSPAEHDRIVSFTSHLPQLCSTALANVVGKEISSDKELVVSGPGLMDMSRLAMSSHEVWHDILVTNRLQIDHALGVYIDKLTKMRENLQTQTLAGEFSIGAATADRLRRRNSTSYTTKEEPPCD